MNAVRTLLIAVMAAGCGGSTAPRDPLAGAAAAIDAAVVAVRSGQDPAVALVGVRRQLSADAPQVRGLAAQAIAAAGDWESMPALIALLDDDDRVVRARAGVAIAELIGVDYHFDADAPEEARAQVRRAISSVYEAMKRRPPERYRR